MPDANSAPRAPQGSGAHDSIASFYEKYVPRCSADLSEYRIQWILDRIPKTTTSLLDVGCGMGRNLELFAKKLPNASLCGIDVAANAIERVKSLGYDGLCCDASNGTALPSNSLDVVVCGEVIEHVIDTDAMVVEMKRLLRDDGILFLTTPNLAYAVNRLLLLIGIQPIFTETSLYTNLGRRVKLFGQGNATQGHLKIFTRRALEELLTMYGFEVIEFGGYNMMTEGVSGKIDAVLRRVPSLAAGFVVMARPRPS